MLPTKAISLPELATDILVGSSCPPRQQHPYLTAILNIKNSIQVLVRPSNKHSARPTEPQTSSPIQHHRQTHTRAASKQQGWNQNCLWPVNDKCSGFKYLAATRLCSEIGYKSGLKQLGECIVNPLLRSSSIWV